jgi:hypothetical protein
MALPVTAVVRRHMGETGRFVTDTLECMPGVQLLDPDETPIGWYRNPAPWEQCRVLFTDKALYSVEGTKVVRIPFESIVGYEFPPSKADASGVRVRTKDGFRFVRIAGARGRDGQIKDAFDFVMVVAKLSRHR